MQQYKVIALSCVGKHVSKIYHAGDIVDDSCFEEGHAELFVKDGFLEPIPDAQEAQESKKIKKEKPAKAE